MLFCDALAGLREWQDQLRMTLHNLSVEINVHVWSLSSQVVYCMVNDALCVCPAGGCVQGPCHQSTLCYHRCECVTPFTCHPDSSPTSLPLLTYLPSVLLLPNSCSSLLLYLPTSLFLLPSTSFSSPPSLLPSPPTHRAQCSRPLIAISSKPLLTATQV